MLYHGYLSSQVSDMSRLIGVVFLLIIAACKSTSDINSTINNIDDPPTFQTSDTPYADVFKSLDGIWEGQFTVYEDPLPRIKRDGELSIISKEDISNRALNTSLVIDVRQEYTSESPYFQRVKITDSYPTSGKVEVSKGVNKVQNGQMWCVVHKPTETVIHHGSTDGPDVIIWQSSSTTPQKIEYFYETVSTDSYEIIGYGYYDGDDIELTPRLWFYGLYTRRQS